MKKNCVSNMSEARRILTGALGRSDIEVYRGEDGTVRVAVGGRELTPLHTVDGVDGIGVRRKDLVKLVGMSLKAA